MTDGGRHQYRARERVSTFRDASNACIRNTPPAVTRHRPHEDLHDRRRRRRGPSRFPAPRAPRTPPRRRPATRARRCIPAPAASSSGTARRDDRGRARLRRHRQRSGRRHVRCAELLRRVAAARHGVHLHRHRDRHRGPALGRGHRIARRTRQAAHAESRVRAAGSLAGGLLRHRGRALLDAGPRGRHHGERDPARRRADRHPAGRRGYEASSTTRASPGAPTPTRSAPCSARAAKRSPRSPRTARARPEPGAPRHEPRDTARGPVHHRVLEHGRRALLDARRHGSAPSSRATRSVATAC